MATHTNENRLRSRIVLFIEYSPHQSLNFNIIFSRMLALVNMCNISFILGENNAMLNYYILCLP